MIFGQAFRLAEAVFTTVAVHAIRIGSTSLIVDPRPVELDASCNQEHNGEKKENSHGSSTDFSFLPRVYQVQQR